MLGEQDKDAARALKEAMGRQASKPHTQLAHSGEFSILLCQYTKHFSFGDGCIKKAAQVLKRTGA